MAYKFQYGDAVYSGSLNIETNLTGSKVSLGTANSAASVARGTLDLSDADGASYGVKLGGTLVTATAAELNLLDGSSAGSVVNSAGVIYSGGGHVNATQLSSSFGLTGSALILGGTAVTSTAAELNYVDTTAGTAAASKAVILDADKSITGIQNLTASFFNGDGSGLSNISAGPAGSDTQVQFNQNGSTAGDSGLVYDGSGSLDLVEFSAGSIGLKLGGTLVTATAAELNLLDTATAGSVVNSKAVIYSAAGKVQGTTFLGPDDVTFGGASVTDMITIGSDEVVFKDGSINVNIASHDGSNGLELGSTLVTSTAAELNYVDVTAGTATLSKALVLDADLAIGTILNLTASAAKFTTVDINGGAIDGAVIGASSAVSGTFTGVVATSLSISDGAISNVSDISLDTISADDGSSFSFASNWTAASRTCANLGSVTTADINGGTIDGTTIGVSSAAVVTASYLAVNGNVDLGNGSDVINIGSGGSDSLYLNAMANFEAGAAYNMQSIASNDTLSAGDFYNIVSGSGDITVTLPNVSNIDDGTMFHVKRAYGMEHDVTVASGSGQNSIDGEALVVLESELAAISLLWDSNAGVWHIF
jgi:hypothetical protein